MKVGTICKLKVDCLGNKAGTLGVVFYDYGDGFQCIFENGNLDGFSTSSEVTALVPGGEIEADYFLEEIGFEESLAGYQFKNVVKVAVDYKAGVFNIAWSEKWQGEYEPFGKEYEKCKVYADGNRPSWLRFKRKWLKGEGVTVCLLSGAMDYEDFSHFEYADLGKSIYPRWMQANKTTYPLFVVFRKKL